MKSSIGNSISYNGLIGIVTDVYDNDEIKTIEFKVLNPPNCIDNIYDQKVIDMGFESDERKLVLTLENKRDDSETFWDFENPTEVDDDLEIEW
jgi:hypothetical protein